MIARYLGSTNEDPLTGTILTQLLHLPIEAFWGLVRHACYTDALPAQVGEPMVVESWRPWDATGTNNERHVKPDVFMRFASFDLIIEAKRWDDRMQSDVQWRNEVQAYPMFEPVAKPTAVAQEDEVFFCKGAEADGRGLYTQEGFVVLQGSSGRAMAVPSTVGNWPERVRNRLISAEIIREDAGRIVFLKDHLFSTPSEAAVALLGRNANGWTEWKNARNETLDKLKRQVPV